jgi:hypothetical protein
MDKRNMLLFGAIIGVAILLTNVIQFLIWHSSFASTKAAYDKQILALQATLKQIGPLTDVYTVKNKTDGGQALTANDLVPIKMPESIVQNQYVLDPSQVVGKFLKITLNSGTPILNDLLMQEKLDPTSRQVDVVCSMMTVGLKVGDYIDYRITFPTGEDYIVLSHKRVYGINGKSIKLILNETEIQMYNSALVDWYLHSAQGAVTYTTKYTDPGIQTPAKVTYSVPSNIESVIQADPNIVDRATSDLSSGRELINSAVSSVTDSQGGAMSTGRTSEENSIADSESAYDQAQKNAAVASSTGQPSNSANNGTYSPQNNSATSSKLMVGKGVQ